MRKLLLMFCLSLSACQAPTPPGTSVSPSPSPSASSSVMPSTRIPDSVPRGNQRLTGGTRQGSLILNQLDDQGNGVVLWALGDPIGQRFTAFKAGASISNSGFPTDGLTWSLDNQGNGHVFYRKDSVVPAGAGGGSPPNLQVYKVLNYLPQPGPEIWPNAQLISLQKDASGNGWLLTASRAQSSAAIEAIKAYRLRNHQMVAGDVQTLPEALNRYGFLLDAEGKGLAIRDEDTQGAAKGLWLQRIERLAPVGVPEFVVTNSSNSRYSSELDGQTIVGWLVNEANGRPLRYDFIRVEDYRPGSRVMSIPINQNDSKVFTGLQLNQQGDGILHWQEQSPQPGKNNPLSTNHLQAVKAYQPGQSKVLFSSGEERLTDLKIQLSPDGRGLAVLKQQPWASAQESAPNQDNRLLAIPLENFLPSGEALTLSEKTQAGVESLAVQISPQGHGLITWTQFNQRCEQINCSLDQTVWSRAVYGFRVP
jgi:hypothetical protein